MIEDEFYTLEEEKALHESKTIDNVMFVGATLLMLVAFLGLIDWMGVI